MKLEDLPSSWKEAKSQGYSQYFTGRPCKYGHYDVRYVVSGRCKTCSSQKAKEKYWEDPEKHRERSNTWRKNNIEKARARDLENYHKDRERKLEQARKYRDKNREKLRKRDRDRYWNNLEHERWRGLEWKLRNRDHIREYDKIRRKENPHKQRVYDARRRANKIQATPNWAHNEFEEMAIEKVYAQARELTEITGVQYSVDHIVPLQSELVCGLHCFANLQVVTKRENSSKRNRHWPNMPDEPASSLQTTTTTTATSL